MEPPPLARFARYLFLNGNRIKLLRTTQQPLNAILDIIQSLRSKDEDVAEVVRPILNEVREQGDAAVRAYTKQFNGIELDDFRVSVEEFRAAHEQLNPGVLEALKLAQSNIELFHRTHVTFQEPVVETMPGVDVWREWRPIEKIGLYVPGGTASYPSTVLMTAVPAKLAGCREMIICTPCDSQGRCNPAVLVAADLCGVNTVYKVGGAQAIAAMAYGTETIPKVYKICGPGNQYVSTAKLLVFGEVDIDKPAGPSEVEIIADDTAIPSWMAADLLSQLEHGPDSQAILVTFSEEMARAIIDEMQIQMQTLPRRIIVEASFARSFAVVVQSLEEAIELTNAYAPEHLEIVVREANEAPLLKAVNNAGSVFLGKYSSETLGDYATGANHTLPTSSYAKMFSPLSTEAFGKMMQVQRVTEEGIGRLRESVECLAHCEGLEAHARAVRIRFPSGLIPTHPGGTIPSVL